MKLSRREFVVAALTPAPLPAQQNSGTVDLEKTVSRADLIYDTPVDRSEEGIPIGNGRMGTLIWTAPNQLRMQINRVDVYASNSASNSFFERNTDYCGGCAYVDIRVGRLAGLRQHLSVYTGRLRMQAEGFVADFVGWPAEDVIAIHVHNLRADSPSVTVDLRMLRYVSQYFGGQLETFIGEHAVAVRTRNHVATSRLHTDGDRIALTQEFREGAYFNQSAVAIAVSGGSAEIVNQTQVQLTRTGGADFTIFIASAASFDPKQDALKTAMAHLDAASAKTYTEVERETAQWWREFWSRGFVSLRSVDGTADFVEQNYTYFLYLMASSSRGKFPPKFNGMIWNTGGDLRTWGGQHWFANLSCYYEAIPATNRMELMDPVFAMYSGMMEACGTAARQQWGSEGLYIPETVFFDGLEKLPEDLSSEMRDLYLRRKPWEQRSDRFRAYAERKLPHSSRWNWIGGGQWVDGRWMIEERGSGPYGPVSHILGTTAKVPYLYWRQYEFTLDREFLRDRAYPMLKGAAEFYRTFPNVKRGDDGKLHILWTNSNESVWGARDTDEDISAMRGVMAAAIRAAGILGVDAAACQRWKDFLRDLPKIPTSDDAQALRPENYNGPRVFVRGHLPVVKPAAGLLPDANSLPMWFFDHCTLETRDEQLVKTANATFDSYFRNGITDATPVSVLSKLAIAASMLGRSDPVRHLIPNQIRALRPERGTAYKNGGVLANRMTLREGPQALDAQRLGRAAEALQLALLQSSPPAPAEDPVIRVFPAWPADWNAQFRLAARGGFVVSAAMQSARVEFVEVESRAGGECRIRNPWPGARVKIARRQGRTEELTGELLRVRTRAGETLRLTAANAAA